MSVNSARVRFAVSLPDGRTHECVGRLVFVGPAPQRVRYASKAPAPTPESDWVIHVLTGPDLFDDMDKQKSTLHITLSDGRTGGAVITDGTTLRGVTALALPGERSLGSDNGTV